MTRNRFSRNPAHWNPQKATGKRKPSRCWKESLRFSAPYHAFLNLRNDYDRLQQRFSRECAKTARMGDRIDELADENKILRGIAADFDRAKKALGKDKVEAAVESVKQEEARVQAEKHRKRQYTR